MCSLCKGDLEERVIERWPTLLVVHVVPVISAPFREGSSPGLLCSLVGTTAPKEDCTLTYVGGGVFKHWPSLPCVG